MSRHCDCCCGGIPPGLLLIRGKQWNLQTYRYMVLLTTFIAYACYHASRKPTGIVKSVLCPEHKGTNQGWSPFNGHDGTSKLGEIDVAFLACYSMGMYVAGHLGDSLDLRLFLTTGMVGSGIFVSLFGMGYFWNMHSFLFYLSMQMIAGMFQATGWPSVVAVIGNWFGKRKRGLIMGVWNAHTSVGNISGSLLAASVLEYGWGWSFVVPGVVIVLGGVLVYLFLAPYPEDVGFSCVHGGGGGGDEEAQVNGVKKGGGGGGVAPPTREGSVNRKSVGLVEACMIPGVIPFALCLFFAKLVAYTFLYWLPFYLTQTAEIGGKYISVKSAGNLSALFDVGGIFGGILAGYVSDKLNARAITAASFISLKGDSRALATVTAIIDGTGSVGAALGPLLTGFISSRGWDEVFMMLVLGAFIAGLLLSRLIIAEIAERSGKPLSSGQQNPEATASQPLLEER
ncbi:putative glycerol-3-phosphate transporter 4 isoform X4 [Glycine max]|uniref:putative glycerol-3-phosphate transporter 4 isoform X4 n=1 Tax=Glycine max TaxID=3847 RepID=UPI001B357F83|nr:putative glycerol-3-phosphate transporter 4 isoform X4 [Glycine max]